MTHFKRLINCVAAIATVALALNSMAGEPPKVPRFSVANMDRLAKPEVDFYRYACGAWLKANPVPADKSRWSGFDELQQRNWELVHEILETSMSDRVAPPKSLVGEVGSFFASAMDTNRIEDLKFKPLVDDFARIGALRSTGDILGLVAYFDQRGVPAMFNAGVSPDDKNSGYYALELRQGGLGMPDRDYYLSTNFVKQRQAYVLHITKMFTLLGESLVDAHFGATRIVDIETALAKASKSRSDLRDPVANYHKFAVTDVQSNCPSLGLKTFLDAEGLGSLQEIIVRQPEFFEALDKLVKERPLNDWKIYLRWQVLRAAAPCLHNAVQAESFAFYGTVLSGQPTQEPRWQRAAKVIDSHIGEALGQLYVERNFPAAARARMNDLIENLKAVFRDRLQRVEWMSEATHAKALAKFDRFTQKIAYPDKFRDYSAMEIRRDDYLGNVRRAALFESKRQRDRVGKPVDKSEWEMTPQTVNAYFNPKENEIVFPAGILQPPFFDVTMDDAVNYGAIGVVIGHEMTHGYDDEGRKYGAQGTLEDWWTPADAQAFEARVQKIVDQYNGYQALPGLHVNGRLTLGENLADLGGMTIAYEALERDLAKDPAKQKKIDGFTPQQRFFLSYAQLWRTNWREAELRRRITVDPHSPGQFRAIGPAVNLQQFYDAFAINDTAPMWRPVAERAIIW
jgi:putative endopeptidase